MRSRSRMVTAGVALLAGVAGISAGAQTCEWQEVQKLLASNGAADDEFGFSVAVSGDTAIVGAWKNDGAASDGGAAYVYHNDGSGNWIEIAALTPADIAGNDRFGWAVAISGLTAVVGSRHDDDNGFNSGSAYVFQDDGAGNWTEVDKVIASDGLGSDHFGEAVAIFGDTIIVGAPMHDVFGSNSGAAYIFGDDGTGTGGWRHG